jgi:MFS transporter, DHA1 family, multidrug resistance protein
MTDSKVAPYPASPIAIIIILGMLSAFAPLATDLYLPGLHLLGSTFRVGENETQATLSVFFLGLALGQAIYGPLSDRFGRRMPLLFGIAVFIAGTIGCLSTDDFTIFLVSRFVQAIGGSAGMVIGRAVVNDLFTGRENVKAQTLLMVVMVITPIIAPTLGGLILSVASWRVIFLAILIIGFLCGLLTMLFLPETLKIGERGHSTISDAFAAYGRLLSNRLFLIPALVGALAQGSMFAFISGSSFVLIQWFGVSQSNFGYLFGAVAIGMVIAAQINNLAVARWSISSLLGAGLVFNLLMALILVFVSGTKSLIDFMVPLWLTIASIGFIGSNVTVIAMEESKSDSSSGSAVIGVLQFGLAFAASSLVSVTQNGTARPMAMVIFLCSLLARRGLAYKTEHQAPDRRFRVGDKHVRHRQNKCRSMASMISICL